MFSSPGGFFRPLALVFVNPLCPGEKEGQTQEQRDPKSCVCWGMLQKGWEEGEMSGVSKGRSPHQGVPQFPTPSSLAQTRKVPGQVGAILLSLSLNSFFSKLPFSYCMQACTHMYTEELTAHTCIHRHARARVCTCAHELTVHVRTHTCTCTQVELRLPIPLQEGSGNCGGGSFRGQVPWTSPETLCAGGMGTPPPTWGALASQE